MVYLVDNNQYSLSYTELKSWYLKIRDYSDIDFLRNIAEVLHVSCIICWVKEVSPDLTIGDKGLIHELVHLLHIPEEDKPDLKQVRELFDNYCKLV